jgi:hypothetical protein
MAGPELRFGGFVQRTVTLHGGGKSRDFSREGGFTIKFGFQGGQSIIFGFQRGGDTLSKCSTFMLTWVNFMV